MAFTSVSEYLDFLERVEVVRKALLGPPSNSGSAQGGGSGSGGYHSTVRRRDTFGYERGRVVDKQCSIHGSDRVRTYANGRTVCRQCETDYATARRRMLAEYVGKKLSRLHLAHSPDENHPGEECEWKVKPSGGRYCVPNNRALQRKRRQEVKDGESSR